MKTIPSRRTAKKGTAVARQEERPSIMMAAWRHSIKACTWGKDTWRNNTTKKAEGWNG